MVPSRCILLIATTALACGATKPHAPSPGEADDPSHGYAARIRRTSFGIPHIDAADERGLGYGIGYAFAEDNACVLAEAVVTVAGQRSRQFGADATVDLSGADFAVSNQAADVYFSLLNQPAAVAATWAAQPPEIQNLVRGYARGFNRYLRDAAGRLPEACREQPWVHEITELDLVRLLRRYVVEASGVQMLDAMFAAQPPATQAGHAAATAPPPSDAALARMFRTSLGSNAVALGRDATASGTGLLLAAPHFPWTGVLRFYQLHITIPGKVDAMGATLAGLPVVAIGHNAAIAWAHTVNSSRHFALYQLALDPGDPTRYLVDGRSIAMTSTDVAVAARAATGEIATLHHRVWSTEFGPVVTISGLFPWTAHTAFAFADANRDNMRLWQTWWAIDRARSLAELRAAVEPTLASPWVHTIAVDAAGTAYYGDVTAVPDLPAPGERCSPPDAARFAAHGLYVVDGSTARCRWVTAPGSPIAGLVPPRELPTLTRTDFVQNSNDSAWLSNPAAPLTGFPAIVSIDGTPLRPRTRLGIAQITAELAAGRRLTADRLLALAFSNRALGAEILLDDLRALCARSSDPALARPCATLARWDGTAELASVGWPLFRAWRRALDDATRKTGLSYWTVAFDRADPVHTPRGLRISDPAVATAARAALVAATQALDAADIDFTRPWGELQRCGGGHPIAIHGGGGDHFGDGGDDIYNTINSRWSGDHFEPYYGSSLVMAIAFDGGAPTARGVLAYSQSSDPASPHHADQTERFSRKDWITLPFRDAAIAGDPALTTERIAE
jgi:acyl-homoserine-lactone acylase